MHLLFPHFNYTTIRRAKWAKHRNDMDVHNLIMEINNSFMEFHQSILEPP